jgi:hypothetical protein
VGFLVSHEDPSMTRAASAESRDPLLAVEEIMKIGDHRKKPKKNYQASRIDLTKIMMYFFFQNRT